MAWHPDMPIEYRDQIVTGDARMLAERIPDASVDLILCDPVYWQIEDYKWLAETGARVLKQGGNCIAQTGHYHLPAVLEVMKGKGLDYIWVIAEHLWGTNGSIYQHRIIVNWKPHVWFAKGRRNGRWVMDWIKGGGKDKGTHEWGDAPELFLGLVERLTEASSVVFDPFTGGGTVPAVCKMLGRHYVAFEIDPDTAERARKRVRNTQPPLPGFTTAQPALLEV